MWSREVQEIQWQDSLHSCIPHVLGKLSVLGEKFFIRLLISKEYLLIPDGVFPQISPKLEGLGE